MLSYLNNGLQVLSNKNWEFVRRVYEHLCTGVNVKTDERLASRFTNTAEDGVAILDPLRSIHYSSNHICYFDVDRFINRKLNVVESKLTRFAQSFSESNGVAVDQAVKKARRENHACIWKGN